MIEGATDVRIALSDGREFAVDVVVEDEQTDLAVLRVRDPGDALFPAITFADSDALQVGDLVLAIGNPFGVGQTVTSGIVSALARTGVESSNYEFFIQTDAAINPGNSGGPSSTWRGIWSASTPPSIPSPAARSASALPSPPTWPRSSPRPASAAARSCAPGSAQSSRRSPPISRRAWG